MMILEVDGKKYLDDKMNTYIQNHENMKVISALHGVNLNEAFDSLNITFLHLSVKCKNVFLTEFLIQQGVEIDPQDNNGETPLIMAVKSKHLEHVKLLLTANANLNIADGSGKSVLTMVFQLKHRGKELEIIKLFLMKLAVICPNEDNLVKTLIRAGCSLDTAVYLNNSNLMAKMLQYGYQVDRKHDNNLNNTALHVAAALNYLDIVKVLLQFGADVCVPNKHGRIPLIHGIIHQSKQNPDVIEALMPISFDWTKSNTVQSVKDRLPLFYIFTEGTKETLKLFQTRYTVDLTARDLYGETPLHYLMTNKNDGILEPFWHAEFDVNAQDFRIRTTALHLAAMSGVPDSVRFLLERGAETNSEDLLGQTPLLHIFNAITTSEIRSEASKKMENFAECVELLMLYGADPEVKFMFGTILDYATHFKTYSLIESVVARFVLLEISGIPMKQRTYDQIDGDERLRSYYVLCLEQIENTKRQFLHGRVTVYDILTESEEKIALYTRRQEVTDILVNIDIQLESYYRKLLTKRLHDAAKINNLRHNAALLLSESIGLFDPDHLVINNIVCLLSKCDLKNIDVMTARNH